MKFVCMRIIREWSVYFWVILLLLNSQSLIGQTKPYRPNEIISPSPTAAALGHYGNVPVSYYNGTPNISIPIYTIKTLNNNLNVELAYAATGTKVLQDASWVGLGWSLNAGGCISRIVRQKDDFLYAGGYYTNPPLPTQNDIASNNQATNDYLDNVYNGVYDGEPDIFSYNFAGYSGRFVLGKKNDGSPVFVDEKNNLEIKRNPVEGVGWIISDGQGYKFYFTTNEISQNYFRTASFELSEINGLSGLNFDINSSPVTSWYLDSIVAPTNEAIKFIYNFGKSLSLLNKSEHVKKLDQILVTCPSGDGMVQNNVHTYDASRQELTDVYLKKILFSNGEIEFTVSDRKDIEYNTSSGYLPPSKLDSIIVKNSFGAVIKKYAFNYSYFGGENPRYGRLKLDSLIEFGSTSISIHPPYRFTYYNSNTLPDKYSKDIDHWGFYNSNRSVNSSLLPSAEYPSTIDFTGANREADTLNNYPINGVLSRIQYPTNGSTKFEYEIHDFSNLIGAFRYSNANKYAYVRANPTINPSDTETVADFTVHPDPIHPDQKILVTITCSYQKVDPNMGDGPVLGYSNLIKKTNHGDSAVADCSTANYDQPNPSPTQFQKFLEPGDYHMSVLSSYGWSRYMSVAWKEKVLIADDRRKGGGIRIKKITDIDESGNSNSRSFRYDDKDGKSTGILLSLPVYSFSYEATHRYMIPPSPAIPNQNVVCDFTGVFSELSTGSIYPSGLSSKSGVVGYSKVTELAGENGEDGKTEYYFHNQAETVDPFPGVPATADPFNGKLDSVLTIDKSGICIKKIINKYLNKEYNTLSAIKLFTSDELSANQPPAYYVRFYSNLSNWIVNSETQEWNYSHGNYLIDTKVNCFDNPIHREITQSVLSKSNGLQQVVKFLRPGDYVNVPTASFLNQLQSKHIITPVIEQQTLVQTAAGRKLAVANFIDYERFQNSFYKPEKVYAFEAASPSTDTSVAYFNGSGSLILNNAYKQVYTYNQYGIIGNILERQKADDVKETYLWGYSSQYPVVKIMGSNLAAVLTIPSLDTSLLNNGTEVQRQAQFNVIRSYFSSSPQVQISTYTYAPLIGMTSETAPSGRTTFYEYDGFGRLSAVKDDTGKVLRKICYNYAGREVNCNN